MIGGLAGVGRRRHPGVDARFGSLGERPEAEGRPQPVGGAIADHDQHHEYAEQEQGTQPQRDRIGPFAETAAHAQLLQQSGQPLAMDTPKGCRAGILGPER